jgi:hypothetical protein
MHKNGLRCISKPLSSGCERASDPIMQANLARTRSLANFAGAGRKPLGAILK